MFEDIEVYIEDGVLSFVSDPPDTPYQEGYLAAFKDVLDRIGLIRDNHFPLDNPSN